jgi:hypothetical protein
VSNYKPPEVTDELYKFGIMMVSENLDRVRKADRIVVAQRTLVPESVPVLGLGLAAEDSVSLSWVFAYPHCSFKS